MRALTQIFHNENPDRSMVHPPRQRVPTSSGQSAALHFHYAWRFIAKRLGVSLRGMASSADLGGSSKYSNESHNLEDRSG